MVSVAGFEHIGVVGAGQMGLGIAQVMAVSGLKVTLVDPQQGALDKAQTAIEGSLAKFVAKEKLTAEVADRAKAALSYKLALTELKSAELVIEAVPENEPLKASIFAELEGICPASTLFASNTSSISITRLAGATKRPEQFIGMHFMNPVPIMKLVEVIEGFATSAETTQKITALATAIGKQVTTSQDYPGFVVNRILMPMINEAFTALHEGVASAEDIDLAMKLGTNQPMGPLALADFIGLDTCLAIIEVLYNEIRDPRYRPSTLLVKYVEAGYFGRKSGRGVYTY